MNGPAVVLGDPSIIFPRQLAEEWHRRGLPTYVVTRRRDAPGHTAAGVPVVRSSDYETALERRLMRAADPWALWAEDRYVGLYRARYRRRFGPEALDDLYHPRFVHHLLNARPAARAVTALRPAFVFGQEVNTHGPATALCRGIPRILFPWGADIYLYPETSPALGRLTRWALHAADLVVFNSPVAARHTRDAYGLADERVRAISWGVDRTVFRRADPARRDALFARWRIPPGSRVLLNVRRFEPHWGCFVALESFVRLAHRAERTHFVLLGGGGTERFLERARERIAAAGLDGRFTVIEGEADLAVCADAMSVADVFVSLNGFADMRSSSVLQAASAGGVPVIGDSAEYRGLRSEGFGCVLVPHDDPHAIADALQAALDDPAAGRALVARNQAHIARHEDFPTQMDRLLEAIDDTCRRVRRGA